MPVAPIPTQFAVGDVVLWKGFELIVVDLKPGIVEALSPQWRVSAPPTDFVREGAA